MSLVLRNIKGEELTWDELDGNFNYLESLSGGEGNRIITQTGFSLLDQDLTINAGWVWKISGIEYTNENAVVLNFPYAAASNERLDLVVLTASNSFDRIAGPESETNPVAPSVPNNTLLLTIVSITDGSINEPSEPILGTQFKEKSENRTYNDPFLSGENAVAQLRPEGFTYFSFGSESLISLAGFSSDLLTGNANAKTPYLGQDFMIVNSSASVFVLKHGGVAEIALALPNGADLEVPVGGKILFKYRNGFMEMIFKSWNDPVDLSSKADLVDGKVPSSQLPSYVDDVLEFTNLSAFPTTGETGKIYVALDTNFTYRWSGSSYVQIGGGSKSTFYIEIPISQSVSASTSWWGRDTATQTIFNATFTTNAGWTPTNDFANINVQRPSNLVPFDCKIKRVLLKGHSNSAATNVRFCVVKSKGQSGGAIANSKIIADKTISTSGTIFEFEFTGSDLDTVTTLDKGSEIRLVFFNNNVASNLFSTIMLIEFEEL
jgi:hypothetical protein